MSTATPTTSTPVVGLKPLYKLNDDHVHHSEPFCCGLKDRVMGVVLAILALGIGTMAFFLLKDGFVSIPNFTTGLLFSVGSFGLLMFAIVMILRKSAPHNREGSLETIDSDF